MRHQGTKMKRCLILEWIAQTANSKQQTAIKIQTEAGLTNNNRLKKTSVIVASAMKHILTANPLSQEFSIYHHHQS